MFAKLFRSSRPAAATPAGSIPAGRRIYAIGDIHGRLDLLDALLDKIEADDAARPPAETMLIFLGDLIDRGPESAQVVARVMEVKAALPSTRILMGNHEEVFLMALSGDLPALKFFVRIGGKPTILSYGIDQQSYDDADYAELMAMMQAQVPEAHAEFMRSFEDLIVVGDYAFVHAGIDPAVPLEEQRTKDLRWIREVFLNHRHPLDKIIVHGHTIADEVELLPHRIGLDTGAYASNRLSALGVEGEDRWIIQT